MANTRGFQIVAEMTVAILRSMLQAASQSGGASDPGTIPQNVDIPAGTMFGPYTVEGGQAQVPQADLDVAMAPDVNGLDLIFGLQVQVQIQNPPVPSASLFNMTATVRAKAPVGPIDGGINLGILLGGIPRANVRTTLTSGDPIAPQLDTFITEFVHGLYQANGASFPHNISQTDQTLGGVYTYDASADLYDDPTDPAHQISVNRAGSTLTIAIPVHVKIFNIRKGISFAPTLLDPMGIETVLTLTGQIDLSTPGQVNADLRTFTPTVGTINPAGAAFGNEGANYTSNKGAVSAFVDLDSVMANALTQQANSLLASFSPIQFAYPSVPEIETLIGDVFYQKITAQGAIAVWTPDADSVNVTDVTPKALADVLAIALNAGAGADADALDDFVPGGALFGIALDGAHVLSIIDQTIHLPEDQGGFGPDFPHTPHRVTSGGHKADLKRLDVSLTSAIHLDGDITVIDAIAGSIDVDASFTDDIGLHWADNSDGSQQLVADPGSPDVSVSAIAWILGFILGFISFGLLGGIVAAVIIVVVEGVASSIGAAVVRDQITHVVQGIGAWPTSLKGIGTIDAKFENPVEISSDGILFHG